jgi:putative membrane protein
MIAMVLTMVTLGAMDVRGQGRLNDGEVVALFDEANTADIWTARLALSKSESAEVRRLASMVIADHEAVQHTLRELAKKHQLTATPPADDDSAATLAATLKQLRAKRGAEFDRAYITHELAFHRSAIDAVRGTLLHAAKNQDLKSLLQAVLGGFEHHLAETRAVAGTLGVK